MEGHGNMALYIGLVIEFILIGYMAWIRNMVQLSLLFIFFGFSLLSSVWSSYVNESYIAPGRVRYYPKKSLFRKSDLIDFGCSIFITKCPKVYKQTLVCARHYDGNYKTFENYCEMEYENCNSWRQWSMIKRARC